MRLDDGRILAWYEFGDPQGRPCVYVPGTPESGLAGTAYDAAARRAGVRWVSVDKPGYGHSDALPGRSLSMFADDVRQLADHLGLGDFAVAGESGGGPHALAVAAILGARVGPLVLLGSAGPGGQRGAPRGMTPMNTLLYWCLRFGKAGVRGPLAVMAASMRHASLMRLLGPFLDAGVPEADRRLATDPEYAPRMSAVPDAFRQGTSAAAAELVMLRKAWDIDLADVSGEVHVWHGRHDANVPLALAEALSRQIPGSTPHFMDDSAHSVGFVHRDAVMKLIATTAESTLASGGPSA